MIATAFEEAAVIDRIATMRLQEESAAYQCVDYLARADDIDAECRSKMCRWSFQIVDFCKFSPETVSIAMNYLDRFLATSITSNNPTAIRARTSRKQYQLASMAALYIAVKINEPLEMDTALVSELSRGCYTPIEIARAEADVLNALGWRTSGPTPLGFFQHFLALLPKRARDGRGAERAMDLGRAQTEFAAAEYELSGAMVPPSAMGMAALLNALEAIDYRGDEGMDENERIRFLARVRDISGVDPFLDEDVHYARSILALSFSNEDKTEIEPEASEEQQQQQQQQQVIEKKRVSSSSRGGMETSPVCVANAQ
eukprot:CAMPEP_0113552974 /NCGR_PEP_ID=MMETSP0015_2-20120614/15357_1 /TAXON_ID=2838 /ORGANISM="Odontella" /LENGTH=313 /DNA_ID=CAMNT_0000453995 /DNA_START=357 /DNA_END=1298 /DNA_ORIENTATION=+ /assembly_acc=CAM_ASM_000160